MAQEPQVPLGPRNKNCHRCLPKEVPMSRVCHKCSLWKQVRGKDPNTGADVDVWDCVDAWLLTGLFEVAKMVRSNAAATESFRNEVTERADRADAMRRAAMLTQRVAPQLLLDGSDS